MPIIFGDPGGEYCFSFTLAQAVSAGVWNDPGNGWTMVNTAPAGRSNTFAYANGVGGQYLGKFFASSYSHMIAGYAVYTTGSLWVSGQALIAFTNGTNSPNNSGSSQCDLRVADTNGHLAVTRNGTVLGTSTTIMTPGWHFVELDATLSTSATGTADAWLDNLRIIHATGVQTASTVATANRVYFQGAIVNQQTYVKDMYCLDASTTPNNVVLGDVNVVALYANGPGVNSQWTASVGPFTLTSVNTSGVYQGTIIGGASNAYVGYNFTVTGFVNGANNVVAAVCSASTATAITLTASTISETHAGSAAFQNNAQIGINNIGTRPNGDVSYYFDATTNDISDFAHNPLTLSGAIAGVIHVSLARKDDAGARLAAQVFLSGGTTVVAPTVSLTNSYFYYYDPHDVDPNTSSAFTVSGLNLSTAGMKQLT